MTLFYRQNFLMDKHEQSAHIYNRFGKHLEEEHQLESGAKETKIRVVIVGKEQIDHCYHDHAHIYFDLLSCARQKIWMNSMIVGRIKQQP